MRNKLMSLGLIITLSVIAFARPAVLAQDAGQTGFGSWDAVKTIPPGDKVEIKLKTGKKVKGELASVTDAAITVGRGSKSVTTARDDVQRLTRIIKKSSGKPALKGALVGAGIGAGGVAAADGAGDDDLVIPGWVLAGLVGAGIGGLVGSIFGNKKKTVLVYESR